MKRIFLLLSLCCAGMVHGQTSSYSLNRSVTPGAFVSIAGGPGTVIATISGDERTQTSIPIGFTFPYCSATYTTLSAADNGWLSLANSATNNYLSFSNHEYASSTSSLGAIGGGVGLLMPFWDDLKGTATPSSAPADTAFGYYQTSGTTPNRVFTFQWGTPTNRWYSYVGMSLPVGRASFQVKLYETSGVIEYIYDSSTFSVNTATIGICNSTSDYRTLPNETSAIPSASFFYNIDSTPIRNTILQWAPPCPSPPPPNTGTTVFCQGGTTTLSNPTTGGTWASSSVSVATVSTGGLVTGVAGGIVNITYIVTPGCFAISTVTVNPLPDTIGGSVNACEGQTTNFTSAPSGGTWSSSDVAVGTISTSGMFTGLTSGATTISYQLATGCARTLDITVNSQPVISGFNTACLTDTTFLTSIVPGGTWSSSNTARATVGASTGHVMGVSLGPVIITYTAPSGCRDTLPMTVTTICPTSINDVSATYNKLNVYPHPTKGDFYMSIPATGIANITITDICGKSILSKKAAVVKSEVFHFDEGNNLPAGSYILKLALGDEVYIGKLTIIR